MWEMNRSMRRDFPAWMICYVLLGFVQSGLVPVVLPLASPPAPAAGLTYAAFAVTGIAAPFVGAWSDRHRRHRWTLAGGVTLAGLALAAHALPGGVQQHMLSAAAMGLGVASASTVGSMLILEVAPMDRWDRQIGTLQACIGSGQLAGLLVAGVLATRHMDAALLLGAGLLLLAAPLALALAPDPIATVPRAAVAPRPVRGGDAAQMGPARSMHRLTRHALAGLGHSGLTWFLAAWLVSYTATNGLSVMFAVAMVRQFHASATLPTVAYAVGVGLSLALYRSVSSWDARFGPWRVLTAGIGLRACLVAAMMLNAAFGAGSAILPFLALFAATQVVWPLLSVASNTLAVTLSPAHRAESVGLLNAATSLGATAGGALGGTLLPYGFAWLCAAVFGALLVALGLAWHPKVRIDLAAA
jgi:MFS family permease